MSRFEIFMGTWNTTGEVLAIDDAPATVLSATDTYRRLPGREFIVHDAGGNPNTRVEEEG